MGFSVHTYMISNRASNAASQPRARIAYLFSNNSPCQMYSAQGEQSECERSSWVTMLVEDIAALAQDETRPVVLGFYIHGFDVSVSDARVEHAGYGSQLYGNGLDQGLIIGMSWPSDVELPSTARRAAEQSAALMAAIVDVIPLVRSALNAKYGAAAPQLVTAVVCHSMGNYLMSTTLASGEVLGYSGAVERAVMLAPDVDHAIFTQGSEVEDQGQAIYAMAKGNVLVFWTENDAVLELDEWLGDWYVLGYRGPQRPVSVGTREVLFLDSSGFANPTVAPEYVPHVYGEGVAKIDPQRALVHSSYRYVPQLLVQQAVFLREGHADLDLGMMRTNTLYESKVPDKGSLELFFYREVMKGRSPCGE